jgi:exodeoxyribonuclease VII small subunit
LKDKKLEKMSYEEAINRLEGLVRRLEDAEIPLEESLTAFQEGIALSRYCREKLAEIEYKVEYLLKSEQQTALVDDCPANADDGEEDL